MLNVLIGVIAMLVLIEFVSLGVYFLAKKMGYEKPYKVFIPFYCFKVIREVTGPFTVLVIPVTKMARMYIFICVAFLLALCYASWGGDFLPTISAESLWQIMWIVMGLCILLFYLGLVFASVKVYRRFNVPNEKLFVVISLLFVTIPFLFMISSKNVPRSLNEMY
ncbi:MAG: hypothetical protein E7369_00015 [Clostridiales bacterium]|nr:hypothetical protein [Clostridiales bacterium]